MALNPEILGRPVFPSAERAKELLSGLGRAITGAITPAAGTSPATMAGVSIPPAGASLSQLQFKGPLLGTGPMFGIRGAQQPAPQPAQPSFDYGTYAATRGLPSFDVTKTQTPSSQPMASAQQLSSSFAMPIQQQPQIPTQPPIFPTRPQRIDTAVREGTISATPQQLANLNARTTAYEGRTPEQQQALLAQMRQNGGRIAAQQTETMKNFAEGRGARFAPQPAPQGRFGQPLTGLFPQSIEGIAQREQREARPMVAAATPFLTGFERMQEDQRQASQFGMGRSSLYSGMGIGAAIGGLQPANPMLADNATERRRRMFSTI